jgi:hypothetical protein
VPTSNGLDSLFAATGRIALSFDRGQERAALITGTMISDILREAVVPADCASGAALLHVHVGERLPALPLTCPRLVVHTATEFRDATITLATAPWSDFSPARIADLGWSTAAPAGEPVTLSDNGPLCTRDADCWHLYGDLPGVYGRESLRHATADSNVPAILAGHLVMRAILSRMVTLPAADRSALSLITVDAEDQQRYFINREGHCSNIRGTPDDDLQFANSCRTIMSRCESAGLKAVFMVTGDELDPSFVDAFGDQLIGLEQNRAVLDEMTARGHDVACHGFDHEWWISRGRSAITPMTMAQKLRYFFATSGDLRTLFGLARFLLVHGRRLLRARAATRLRARSLGQAFTRDEVRNDIERWAALVGFQGRRLLIRYPGYVRSAAVVDFLDRRYGATVDSSDLYELDDGVPAFPYSLLVERDGELYRSNIIEIPCLWIDKLLRTRDQARVAAELAQIGKLAGVPGSVLSFITHTKVLGSTWGHCHVYLHDPLKGMALPADPAAWLAFSTLLRQRTRSANWRDLQQQLFGSAA